MIRYVFDFDDGTGLIESDYKNSGTSFEISHSFSSAGVYTVSVYARDTYGAKSSTVTLDVHIDAVPISGDDIDGIIIITNGTYDLFINTATGISTEVGNQEDGTVAIDSDADGDFDHVFDPETETVTPFAPGGNYDILPILGLVGLIILFLLILLFFLKRRRKEEQQESKVL
jgi:LPXTG-motif cell wall-anchored protein